LKKNGKIVIIIKGSNLSYKKEVDETTASRILSLCLGSEGDENIRAAHREISVPKDTRTQESIVEYLNRYAPNRNPDKILTLACYLKEVRRKDAFTPEEIRVLFREASEILPGNYSRDFWWTVKNGWIAHDPSRKGAFYVTNSGLNILKTGFPKDLIKKTAIRHVGRSKKSKKASKAKGG